MRCTGPSLDDDIETYHDRVRESVVAHLDPGVARGYHAGLAESLEAAGHAPPETLAGHFDGAGRPDRAGHYYEVAADQAVKSLALDRAEDFYQRASGAATQTPSRARIYEKMIHFYTDLARFNDAYVIGRRAVGLFRVKLPERFIPPLFAVDLVEAKLRLRGRDVASLTELPDMSDERLITAIRLMAAVGKAAYQVRPELCVAVLVKMVNLSRHRDDREQLFRVVRQREHTLPQHVVQVELARRGPPRPGSHMPRQLVDQIGAPLRLTNDAIGLVRTLRR